LARSVSTIGNPDAGINIDDLKITLTILGSSGNIDNIIHP